MTAIIECVPNISEGKNKTKIQKLLTAINNTPNTKLLHHTSDPDHNRTVITFIGKEESVFHAAYNLAKTATEILDLSQHHGIHPRFGVVDVIPFIPLRNITAKELVPLVHQFGDKISQLNIAPYFYEQAATNNQHKNLATLRKHLSETTIIKHNPQFGASCIAVRKPLIAFNINLKSQDLNIAKEIATAIRPSNGGLQEVKSLGLFLSSKNCTQISMNLTDYTITPPQQVFKAIEKLAQKHQIEILESELIGMIPSEIVDTNFAKNLHIKNFTTSQILNITTLTLN
jgi:glutamate formiminotransferase